MVIVVVVVIVHQYDCNNIHVRNICVLYTCIFYISPKAGPVETLNAKERYFIQVSLAPTMSSPFASSVTVAILSPTASPRVKLSTMVV